MEIPQMPQGNTNLYPQIYTDERRLREAIPEFLSNSFVRNICANLRNLWREIITPKARRGEAGGLSCLLLLS
jgi:hypothetical protein